ncbi:histidine phosphatase family protein [Bacteroides sp. 519]|uniref:histidine phosphatase family protein n=1 Tax=Bacteroides sp. 519 TaxID=2302937 RepID=UPI0013D29A47|nr:histidine phosphatase family protein [Bacteroides sp. 519]NDV57721.1 histidine-type phosphatase [Bacteroides sp. 519]
MKQTIFIYTLLISCFIGTATAQNLRNEILQSPEKMGSIYYAYPKPNGVQTPVPKGYTPFYVSHYGRHGSRWMTSDERYLEVLDIFEKEQNNLTALGEDVRQRLYKVWEDAQGRGGDLTPLGERQHKAIAKRLYKNYPQLFKKDAKVLANSSTSPRCIISMAAFCEQLKELNPSLQIIREASKRNMSYIAYTSPQHEQLYSEDTPWKKEFDKFEAANIHPERLMKSLFKQPESIEKPVKLMQGLYWIAADMQDVELPVTFYDIFENEELFNIWETVNYRMYVCNGNCPINEGIAPLSATSLLKNIIESADKAIQEQTPYADLRFGHDTNLIRLLALMQVEGCNNQETDPKKYYQAWQDFRISPMGANLQLIFFKNKKGEVIVKLLHNENEVRLPLGSPTAKPYYKWEQVKTLYKSIIN